jgi:hexosaminidase
MRNNHNTIKSICMGALLLQSGLLAAGNTANYEVVPLPRHINVAQEKPFLLNANTVIVYEKGNESLHKNAILLAEYIKESTGLDPAVTTTPRDSNSISLFNLLKSDNPDSYMISVSPEGIVIDGASCAGNFYGIQTLRKSIPAGSRGE